MRKIITITGLLLVPFFLKAQIAFSTVIPLQPVVVGASFQVQFVIEGAETVEDFKPPSFEYFRIVTGPNIYNGTTASVTGFKQIRNIVFRLVSSKPGKYLIPGAAATINNRKYQSNNAFLIVIPDKEAIRIARQEKENSISNYFLRPGENPYKKIKENLFVKVQVDKKNCYAGEPVLATFKLYSCLESKSDIVKNPGFYGFSIFDMINLSDKEVLAEKINGKIFDVHTIRKVQLFPLQAGTFTIDPMEIRNRVEFSRTAVSKKTEQEIAEGMIENRDEPENTSAVYYETEISTEPVTINVASTPAKNKPADFNGATGKFFIAASLVKDELVKNEEGMLEVTISGTGNFIQLTAPSIDWPEGIDAFEPSVKDDFDKSISPLTGTRTFRFPFVCSLKGQNNIPPIQFNYFDIDSNSYKTISTKAVKFAVAEAQQIYPVITTRKTSITDANKTSTRIAAGIVIGFVLLVLIYWFGKRKEADTEVNDVPIERPHANKIIQPATELINADDNRFYSSLYQTLWKYLSKNFKLEGSGMNRNKLIYAAEQKGLSKEIINKLEMVLSECEAGQFTNASPVQDRGSLLQTAKEVINAVEKNLL
ncbi:MAG: BatD family protein [Chitinophagaceae bacterium]